MSVTGLGSTEKVVMGEMVMEIVIVVEGVVGGASSSGVAHPLWISFLALILLFSSTRALLEPASCLGC